MITSNDLVWTVPSVVCKSCKETVSSYDFKRKANDCKNNNCYLATNKAQKKMAEAACKNPQDFLPCLSGTMEKYPVPVPVWQQKTDSVWKSFKEFCDWQ